jgi:hypothetical protein
MSVLLVLLSDWPLLAEPELLEVLLAQEPMGCSGHVR